MEVLKILMDRREFFLQCLLEHIRISATAVLIASVIGIVVGIFISYHKKFETPVLSVVNVIYTIPSIALLGFLIPFTGIGNKTAIIALTVYGLLPIVRTTHTGFTTLDRSIREAAMSAGASNWQTPIQQVPSPSAAAASIIKLRAMEQSMVEARWSQPITRVESEQTIRAIGALPITG